MKKISRINNILQAIAAIPPIKKWAEVGFLQANMYIHNEVIELF